MPANERRFGLSDSQLLAASETRQLLGSLVRFAAELNPILEEAEIARKVLTEAMRIMDARAGAIFLRAEDEPCLSSRILLHAGDATGARELDACAIPLGAGVCGRVALSAEAVTNNAPGSDLRLHPDEVPGQTPANLACVPLVAKQRVAGVMQVYDRQGGFCADETHLLRALADIAAVSLVNARMHAREVELRKLEHEMRMAREIQRDFLPQGFPEIPGLNFEGCNHPARQVGGDYYNVFIAPGERVCLVVADVSGKGAAASLYMACLHSELRLALDLMDTPAAALERLNQTMYGRSRKGAFVTLLLVCIEPPDAGRVRKARLICAGHPPPLMYLPGRGVEETALTGGFPLGVRAGETYAPVEMELPPGAALLAYSDGVSDARDRAGESFGVERLRATFAAAVAAGGPILPRVEEQVERFTAGAPQYDDITMALVRAEK